MNKMNPINRFGVGLLTSAMIAAGAISAGLSPVVALAANGTVTVQQKDNKQSPYTYDAFEIVSATVVKDGNDYKATRLAWKDNATRDAITGWLETYDGPDSDAVADYRQFLETKYNRTWGNLTQDERQLAQNVVEFIAQEIDASAAAAGTSTTPETKQGDSFAAQLSRVLYSAAGVTPTATVTQGNTETLEQGYWLITSTPSAIENGEAGSAPMWVAVSDTHLNIQEKTAPSTIDKTVKDDSGSTYDKLADGGVGEADNLEFKIASTLPDNIDAFAAFTATVSDALPAGMDFKDSNASSVKVELAGVDITDDLSGTNGSITVNGRNLVVTINNVKDAANLSDANVLTNKNLVVTYEAHLNGSAQVGFDNGVANRNTATLTYDADPNDSSVKRAIESTADVVTYSVTLNKVDEVTRLPLNGAGFKVSTEIDGTTYYVGQDGTLQNVTEANAYEFVSGANGQNGQLVIPRLDEGTYTIKETTAPNSYETANDITLTINSTITSGALTALTATISGGNGFVQGGQVSAISDGNGILGTSTVDGTVEAVTGDQLIIVLPLTGVPIKTAALYGGVAIAVASAVAYVASKRNKEEE